ncbi:MAG: carboxymuconolactone decarboxylase family protein [Porticoccaceae bacterium]|nr:carboxymuconolactone decarboxylase family protein [Porticoccaceae bacterium]
MINFKQFILSLIYALSLVASSYAGAGDAALPSMSAAKDSRVTSADHVLRRQRGLNVLGTLTATDNPQKLASTLEREYGALGSFAVDFVMGDIWSREQLSRRDRNLIVLTMLGALHQTNQLAYYVPGGLNHGLSPIEIREIMTHLAAYAGFPRALDAMAETNRILAELGHGPGADGFAGAERFSDAERRARGAEVMGRLSGNDAPDPDEVLAAMAGKLGPLGEYGIDFAFGEVWARPQLSRRDRSLLVVSVLTALGRGDELDIHVPAALRHGVTTVELQELMLTAFAYAGAPLAVEGMRKVMEHAQ